MYKALKSFSGVVSMVAGEVKDLPEEVAADLLRVGYIQDTKAKVKEEKAEEEAPAKKPRTRSKKG